MKQQVKGEEQGDGQVKGEEQGDGQKLLQTAKNVDETIYVEHRRTVPRAVQCSAV